MKDKPAKKKDKALKPDASPKKSFVRTDIQANKPYGIMRKRQEQMDKFFNKK